MSSMMLYVGIALLAAYLFMKHSSLPISVLSLLLALVVDFELSTWLPQSVLSSFTPAVFRPLLLDIFLPLLLFSGSLSLSPWILKQQWKEVGLLAIGTTLLSMLVLTGTCRLLTQYYYAAPWPWIECALLGTILAPTDPVAVLGLMKSCATDRTLSTLIAGESLFNDAMGIVAYSLLFMYVDSQPLSVGTGVVLVGHEVFLGVISGYLAFRLRDLLIDASQKHAMNTAWLLDLGCIFLVYHTGSVLGYSGALSVIILGLCVSYQGIEEESFYYHLWESIDLLLNILLYIWMGMLVEHMSLAFFSISLWFFLSLSWIRVLAIWIPFRMLARRIQRTHFLLLVASGLKGGLALALVLSLPEMAHTEALWSIIYWVVCFSTIIQGIGVLPLIRNLKHE